MRGTTVNRRLSAWLAAPRGRGTGRLVAVTLGVGFLVASSVTSLALFTNQGTLANNDFTAGTVVLGLSPTSALLTVSNMLPGDASSATLTVSNTGTGSLRYAMTSSATNPDTKNLRSALQLDIERWSAGCTGSLLETLYTGPVSSAAFGNAATGNNPGDRTLGAGSSEVFCIRASVPAATLAIYELAATDLTMTFWAEQTANNP